MGTVLPLAIDHSEFTVKSSGLQFDSGYKIWVKSSVRCSMSVVSGEYEIGIIKLPS